MKPSTPLGSIASLIAALAIGSGCRSEQTTHDEKAHDHAAHAPAADDHATHAPAGDHAAHGHGGAPAAVPAGLNPVQHEMRVLHEAVRDWVTAISNNTLEMIPASIETIHEARMATEAAIEAGTYQPPKNGDQIEAFMRQDEVFHDQLVELLKAANAKDLPAATRHLGTVLEGCTDCHTKYRF